MGTYVSALVASQQVRGLGESSQTNTRYQLHIHIVSATCCDHALSLCYVNLSNRIARPDWQIEHIDAECIRKEDFHVHLAHVRELATGQQIFGLSMFAVVSLLRSENGHELHFSSIAAKSAQSAEAVSTLLFGECASRILAIRAEKIPRELFPK